MIAAGKYGVDATAHRLFDRRAIGTAGATGVGPATPINNMEDSSLTLIGNYAMVKTRHVSVRHRRRQFAAISVATRRHAMQSKR
jgi:hypothetical protein